MEPATAPEPARIEDLAEDLIGVADVIDLMPARPLVKWAGGKTLLVPQILARLGMSPVGCRYLEPFAGGLAVYLSIARGLARPALINDANAALIDTYRIVAAFPDATHARLAALVASHGAVQYYDVREKWNTARPSHAPERAASFLYLNRACFNGLYRENRAGHFNVPVGDYRHIAIPSLADVRRTARALARAELTDADFRAVIDRASSGDRVYVDPPYVPRSVTSSFTGYTRGMFGIDDQYDLESACRAAVSRGARVVVSQSDTREALEIWGRDKAWTIERIAKVKRSIGAMVKSRATVGEILISGGPTE